MTGLFTQALYYLRSALRAIAASLGTAIVATGSIAVALLLTGGFALIVLNMQGLVARFGDAIRVIAFLEEGLSESARESLLRNARALEGVADAELISEEEALERFRSGVGQGFALLEGLGTNPLPASLEVTLSREQRTPARLERVTGNLAALPGVADVSAGSDWIEGYLRALALVRAFAVGLGGVLVLATILIVANTIRLAVLARSDEIEILSLVGASRTFVNTPFLIEGVLQGLAGGLLAWIALYALFRLALPSFESGLELMLGGVTPRFFDAGESAWLWGGGAGLGLLGSGIAVFTESRR